MRAEVLSIILEAQQLYGVTYIQAVQLFKCNTEEEVIQLIESWKK